MKPTVPLTVRIEIRDKNGRTVGEREVASYHGLLSAAHSDGLRSIKTELVQAPTPENGEVAIVRATVTTNRGEFSGIGDANPGNVVRKIAPHLLRMAETRAKARALRDAVNVGVLALDELGDLSDEGEGGPHLNGDPRRPSVSPILEPAFKAAPTPASTLPAFSRPDPAPQISPMSSPAVTLPAARPEGERTERPMSEPQRRLLFRLASQRGIRPDEARAWLEGQLDPELSLRTLSSSEASRFIDTLQGKNGAPHANGAA